MKKTVSAILILTLIIVSVFSLSSYADFGKGVEIVSSDVKLIKTGLLGEKLIFSEKDIKCALCISDFDSITVNSIPDFSEGTLLYAGRKIGEGKTVRRSNIGSLVFVPASKSVTECKFSFTVNGCAGGNSIECIMRFVDKINYEPTLKNADESVLVLNTQQSIGIHGKMEASDPEGDLVEYIIVSFPKHGYINFTDRENGEYRYTPTGNYTGNDKFTFVVRDEYGNYSSPATVNVKVTRRMCSAVYADMEDRKEYNSAVALTAMGIMNGSVHGDSLYFSPDATVSRVEFLSMAMKAMGIASDSTATKTFFDDDGDIPKPYMGYVSVAQRAGIVKGEFENGKLLFKPNEAITKYEAARIMAELLGKKLTDTEETVFAEDDEIPVSARSAVYAMYSLGIYPSGTSDLCNSVTRADAAEYIYRMIKVG